MMIPQVQYFYLTERRYGKENPPNNSCYFNFDLDWLDAFQGFLFKSCRYSDGQCTTKTTS
jgi:hypothetical protein